MGSAHGRGGRLHEVLGFARTGAAALLLSLLSTAVPAGAEPPAAHPQDLKGAGLGPPGQGVPPEAPLPLTTDPPGSSVTDLRLPLASGPQATPPAEFRLPLVASPPPATLPEHRHRWFVLPVVAYMPETGLGGGVTGGLHVPVEGAPRPTSIFASAMYTTQHQGLLDLATDCALPGGAVLGARARALDYPDRFYGIGRSTPSAALEHFTRRSLELVAMGELPIPGVSDLRAGPRLELRGEQIRDKEPGGLLASGTVPGSRGSAAAAGGLSVTWDTRDSPFWPSRGSTAQLYWVYAPAALGRHAGYGRGVLELRHFSPLGHGRVLGLHLYTEEAQGNVPFTLLPRLGSTRFLRGIREGRYRDRAEWVAQSELRSPLFGRFFGAAFAAAGDVGPRLSALRFDEPKLAGGAGLRYRLTDEGANLRLDVAGSRFGVQLYLLVLEAF